MTRISFAQDRATVIERFRCEVLPTLDVRPLIGKSLICFCAPKPCHGDVLLEAAAKAAVAETDSRDSSECPPRAVFADPDPAPPAGGG